MTTRPVALPPTAPPLRVVVGRRVALPRVAPWVMVTLAVVLAFLSLVYSRTALDRSSFAIAGVQTRIAQEQTEYERLRLQVARLRSPARIAPLAESLGLVFPAEARVLTAPGVFPSEPDEELRWAEVKPMLTASPAP